MNDRRYDTVVNKAWISYAYVLSSNLTIFFSFPLLKAFYSDDFAVAQKRTDVMCLSEGAFFSPWGGEDLRLPCLLSLTVFFHIGSLIVISDRDLFGAGNKYSLV